jgi:hypothetical protein
MRLSVPEPRTDQSRRTGAPDWRRAQSAACHARHTVRHLPVPFKRILLAAAARSFPPCRTVPREARFLGPLRHAAREGRERSPSSPFSFVGSPAGRAAGAGRNDGRDGGMTGRASRHLASVPSARGEPSGLRVAGRELRATLAQQGGRVRSLTVRQRITESLLRRSATSTVEAGRQDLLL